MRKSTRNAEVLWGTWEKRSRERCLFLSKEEEGLFDQCSGSDFSVSYHASSKCSKKTYVYPRQQVCGRLSLAGVISRKNRYVFSLKCIGDNNVYWLVLFLSLSPLNTTGPAPSFISIFSLDRKLANVSYTWIGVQSVQFHSCILKCLPEHRWVHAPHYVAKILNENSRKEKQAAPFYSSHWFLTSVKFYSTDRISACQVPDYLTISCLDWKCWFCLPSTRPAITEL